MAATLLICLGLLPGWAMAGDGNVLTTIQGLGDLSWPMLAFMLWREVRKLWSQTIEIHQARATSVEALADNVAQLTAQIRELTDRPNPIRPESER
jgi:hypothetical protein